MIDGAAEADRDVPRSIEVGLRHGDGELVAADPRADVGGTHHTLQLLCDKVMPRLK